MKETRVWVRRERPTVLAWSIALAVTMLAVYALTWTAAQPEARSVAAVPRVTREIELEGMKGWCVTLGRFSDAGQARVEAAGCAARGAAGGLYEADGAWQVLGAMYDSEAQARRAAKKIVDGDDLEAGVLPMEVKEARLRVTAPETQIDLIEGADALLRRQAGTLGTLAVQLEKGQAQPEAVRTLCALAATEAGAMAEKLNVFPGASENALCAALTERLGALSEQLNAISRTGQSSVAALAGMLRLAGIDDFMGLVNLRERILGG